MQFHFLENVKLGCAGQVVYHDKKAVLAGFENGALILAVHSKSPEGTHELATKAWDSIPDDLRAQLQEQKLGFAVKQI